MFSLRTLSIVGISIAFGACSLNPVPLPPNGASADAGAAYYDGEATPPRADSAAPSDAAPDAAALSDAAQDASVDGDVPDAGDAGLDAADASDAPLSDSSVSVDATKADAP